MIEVLVIVGVVDGSGNYEKVGGGAGEGAAPPPQCKSSIDSAIPLLGNTLPAS